MNTLFSDYSPTNSSLARNFLLAAFVLTQPPLMRSASAVTLLPGDIIVGAQLSSNDWGLLAVDPTTGNRTIISDNTHGTGVPFSDPTGVSLASDGTLLVPDTISRILYRVDPSTGNRTIVTSDNVTHPMGTGPDSGFDGARQFGNVILLSSGGIQSVDPGTGNRTMLSGEIPPSGPTIGTGPGINAFGFVISGNHLFASAVDGTGLLAVDALTGNRTTISDTGIGSGPLPSTQIVDVEFDNAGNLLLSTLISGPIFRVDPVTGNRTIVSGVGVGSGPNLPYAGQIGVEANGTLIMAGFQSNSVLSIDPLTGNRSILSDATHGTGPSVVLFTAACTVVPAPEPSTLILAALSGLALLAMRRRR